MLPKLSFPFNLFTTIIFISLGFAFLFSQAGWYELAEIYETGLEFDSDLEQRSKRCRCKISKDSRGSFNGVIIAFLESGIYLNSGGGSLPVFNIIAPSLVIPWQDISNYEIGIDGKNKFYLGNPMITILTLSAETVRELEELSEIKASDRLDNK